MLAGAVGMGIAAFVDPALVASPYYDKIMFSLAIGGLSMEAGAIANALSSNRGTGVTIRQPAAYRQVVRGVRRVGGVMVDVSTTGSQHDQYNVVIVLAGHEVDAIENMYIDGRQVYWQGSGPGWSVRNGTGFGGIADGNDHVGPGGQWYNFGGTGHSGLYVEARYGDQLPGDVIGALTANDPNWAPDGNGNSPWGGGCCYVYVKLEYNTSLYPSGPSSAELKFTVRGKNDIWDPRTGTRGYTANWALQIGDLLSDPTFGLGDTDGVDQAQLIAAANVCEELVPLANGTSELRYQVHWMYDTSTAPGDALANLMPAAAGRLSRIGGSWMIWPAYWTGPSFDFDASVLTGPVNWMPRRALRERVNRVNGTYIAANVPYNDAGNLYDSNGWYNGTILNNWPFAFQPTNFPQYAADVLHGYAEDLYLEADSGVLGAWSGTTSYAVDDAVTESGVIYKSLLAANLGNDPSTHSAPSGPTTVWSSGVTYAVGNAVSFTLANSGAWVSTTSYALGAGVTYGGVLYASLIASNLGNEPDTSPADWVVSSGSPQEYVSLIASNLGNQPGVSPSAWAAVAWLVWNNQLPLELDLNCVLSVAQAQRVAKIMMMRNRQEGVGTLPMHLSAWQTQPVDVLTLTFPEYNWAQKQLEVASTRFSFEQQGNTLAVRFEAHVQETDASVYEWSTTEELTVYDVPSNPVQMPNTIAAPTGVTLSSSSATALLGADGINYPRLLVTWVPPADVRVVQVQIQYQQVGASSYTDAGAVGASNDHAYVGNVLVGTSYDVQICSLANNGATSVWVQAGPVTASGPASQVSGYSNAPAVALTNPTSTTLAMAAVTTAFGSATAQYAARTLTITAPTAPTWYYVTIADPSQAGESGTPTLTATASTSTALVGVAGNTYMGAILALPAGGGVNALAGGWPSPQTVQVS